MIRRGKKKSMPIVPIASMGDIAFLLIIFFILNSNFVTEANIKLAPPQSTSVDKMDSAVISITMDENGILRCQGQEASVTGLQSLIEAQMGDSEERILQVRIDENLKTEQYMPVMEAISAAGVTMNMIGVKNTSAGG